MGRTTEYRTALAYRNAELYQGDPDVQATAATIRLDKNVGVDISHEQATYQRSDKNVGVNIAHEQATYQHIDSNVGVDLAHERAAYQRTDLGDVDTSVPTPHIWYLIPNFGREGHEFKVVGHGFGDTQGEHADAKVKLNGIECGVISWQFVDANADGLGANRAITPDDDEADPEHQEIRVTVPVGATSGLVKVEHNDP